MTIGVLIAPEASRTAGAAGAKGSKETPKDKQVMEHSATMIAYTEDRTERQPGAWVGQQLAVGRNPAYLRFRSRDIFGVVIPGHIR